MRRDDICLYLGPADRSQLEVRRADRNTPRKVVWRAEIVLATADGCGTNEIMRRAETSKPTVWRWQERYLEEGVAGLRRDKTRPSRVPPLPREMRLKVIAKTVQESPPNATHWSRAAMAEAVGISPSSVGRIWAEAGLKPHLTRAFKVSNAPMFEDKPFLRFYAGALLAYVRGIRLGALCLLDTRPRDFSPEDRAELERMADEVVSVILEREFERVSGPLIH